MASTVVILGEHPLAKDPNGKLRSRIGTVFPFGNTIVTLPGIHATQRLAYVDHLNRKRQAEGLPPLTREEETAQWRDAVDLVMEDDTVLIRPDPGEMPLAFAADELLQQLVAKRRIKFLYVRNEKVRDAIKRRGECWRITALPTSVAEMKHMIAASKIGIGGRDIYYYNKATGSRFLTYHEFTRLGTLDDKQLREHLGEIQRFSVEMNHQGYPEIGFFMADRSFSKEAFAGHDFSGPDSQHLRKAYEELWKRFCAAVQPPFRHDEFEAAEWRNRMFASLIAQKDEVISEETMLGLSPEFFMQIRWLPGGRIVDGELILDVFEEPPPSPGAPPQEPLYDESAREFIYNLIREYGDLEYVNVGRVVNSLSRRPESRGRRDVYIAEMKERGIQQEIVSIVRMQKWGVREHLNKGMSLLLAMFDSEEYTEYVLDRRFGCRQLGMNLPSRVTARKIAEKYVGNWTGAEGVTIWSPYFERPYIRGIATDKMPRHRFANEAFALQFARLLGMAAAPNIIVGRCDIHGNVLFDDGDEVVVEDESGMPAEIVVSDQTGTFGSYDEELHDSAASYAGPVNRRVDYLSDPEEFARVYLAAFVERFLAVQRVYRSRRRALDTLFKNRKYDKGGSFAYRWEQILKRLDQTDPRELEEVIRANLTVEGGCEPLMQLQSP